MFYNEIEIPKRLTERPKNTLIYAWRDTDSPTTTDTLKFRKIWMVDTRSAEILRIALTET